jgi:hypothetical protein
MNFKNKRGAIELSMTTIIVIVIGVVLLSLGLLWVKNTFSKVGALTDDAFNNAKDIIPQTQQDPKLTVPSDVSVKKGSYVVLHANLINDGSAESNEFKVTIKNADVNKGVSMIILGTDGLTENSYTLTAGESLPLRIGIYVDNTAIIKPYFDYSVEVNDGAYDSKGFVVNVESK